MCNRYFLTKTKRYKTVGNCITMLGCGRQCKTDIGQQFGGFDMPLVSEDLSSMTVWTILYYTRYVGKLSRRSLSYLCPDLPSFVRKHYNRRSLWLSSSCERASFKCNKPQVCKYADSIAHTQTLTFVGATSRFVWAQSSTFSTRYIIVGAIRPMLHQCDITSTAPECTKLLCFKQQLRLFLAIIVLLFFIQIVYNLEIEAVIH